MATATAPAVATKAKHLTRGEAEDLRAAMKQSALTTYLNRIGKVPLLTPTEEIELGRLVQRMVALREVAQERELTKEELRQKRLGERAAKRFVEANLRLVVSMAKKYTGLQHLTLEDLIQEANMGLMRAVERFDPTRGYRFSTYAFDWCRQAISRAITKQERTMRLPGRVGDMAARWSRVMGELTLQLGRSPSVEELAATHKLSVDEVKLFTERGMYVCSLDKAVSEEDGITYLDMVADVADPHGKHSLDNVVLCDMQAEMEKALQGLTDRERRVLEARDGAEDKPLSLQTLAQEFGVSRSRIGQLEKIAYHKMRKSVRHLWDRL